MNPTLMLVLCSLISGATIGGGVVNLKRKADIATLKTEQATALAAAEKDYTDRYQSEVDRGNGLADQLAQTTQQLNQRTLEVSHAISKVTTGKRCLDNAAVRLLNRRAPASHTPVPKATSQPIAESSRSASDTDVAEWIGGAQGQYAICKAQLNALIDFELGRPDVRTTK